MDRDELRAARTAAIRKRIGHGLADDPDRWIPHLLDDLEADDAPEYPHPDGDFTVIGPECFASADGSVICWRGENYYRDAAPPATAPKKTPARRKAGQANQGEKTNVHQS